MCPPDCYDVHYVINPWMEGNVHRSSRERAISQWRGLRDVLARYADIELMTPREGLPDLVFTANAGLVLGNDAIISRFVHPERQGEEPHFKAWFALQGYAVHQLPRDVHFEGAGDALLDRGEPWLWAGYGFRSSLRSHEYLANWLDVDVVSLKLVDNRFYHLDTCFCPLGDGYVMYYPGAFDAESRGRIEARVPVGRRIVVEEADAAQFACNAINLGVIVVMNRASHGLKTRLASAGFEVIETQLDEFLKAGGAAKCLTLKAIEEPIARASELRFLSSIAG